MHMFAKKQLMQHHKIDKLTVVPFFKFSFTLPTIKPFALFLRTNKNFSHAPNQFLCFTISRSFKIADKNGIPEDTSMAVVSCIEIMEPMEPIRKELKSETKQF